MFGWLQRLEEVVGFLGSGVIEVVCELLDRGVTN